MAVVRRRAALSINCSETQARKVREFADRERRTISAYVLDITLRAVGIEERFLSRLGRLYLFPIKREPGPRTSNDTRHTGC